MCRSLCGTIDEEDSESSDTFSMTTEIIGPSNKMNLKHVSMKGAHEEAVSFAQNANFTCVCFLIFHGIAIV